MKQLHVTIIAVVHFPGFLRDNFAYILSAFTISKKKEGKIFGEFMPKRNYLEEYERIEGLSGEDGVHS